MSIKVRYFASLKEQLGREADELDAHTVSLVSDVWRAANPEVAMPDNVLAAIDMEYVALDTEVKDNVEVAFFPPVTGG